MYATLTHAEGSGLRFPCCNYQLATFDIFPVQIGKIAVRRLLEQKRGPCNHVALGKTNNLASGSYLLMCVQCVCMYYTCITYVIWF